MDVEYLEEHAAGTNNDSTFNDTARHLEVLSFTHNCFTPPLLRGEKLPSQLKSDPAAVYDASRWGCAQLRPANETKIFGTKQQFCNIILFVHQQQTGPVEKQKGGFDFSIAV